MSIAVLSAHNMMALERAAMAQGLSLESLLQRAVAAIFKYIDEQFIRSKFQHVALLCGGGHNGADALGVGCLLLKQGRQVSALLVHTEGARKPLTEKMLIEFVALGGHIEHWPGPSTSAQDFPAELFARAALWVDGLFGFGLNRPVHGAAVDAIEFVNAQSKPTIALDVPSGLSCDHGKLENAPHIYATHTLALGALKPVHVEDSCLSALGKITFLDLNLLPFREDIAAPQWTAQTRHDLMPLLNAARRPPAAHKLSHGRLLLIAGSRRYPGAGVLACLGAHISGAGMIHALLPEPAHAAVLQLCPEIIFEKRIPNLDHFTAVVLGPGWVPGDRPIFEQCVQTARARQDFQLILDAGGFFFLKNLLDTQQFLSENIIITPHFGEFSRLFPEPAARSQTPQRERRIHRLEAAAWAAQMSNTTVVLKGARTCIATPKGEVNSIFESSPLLAHAGHGDVLAGLLGGLCARGMQNKKAALLAALMQSQAALQFSETFPAALTLPPSELVRQMQRLLLP